MVEAGSSAGMECAAQGVPAPKLTWKKDFGADFHAAIERRINSIQPNNDQFTSVHSFIMQRVKGDDTGVYTCTAENPAGIISWNMSLLVLDMPRCVCFLGSTMLSDTPVLDLGKEGSRMEHLLSSLMI